MQEVAICLYLVLAYFTNKLRPFFRNSNKFQNSFNRFPWNFAQQKANTQGISSVKHFQRKCGYELKLDSELKTIVTSLARDIHSDLQKINIILWFSPYAIHVS